MALNVETNKKSTKIRRLQSSIENPPNGLLLNVREKNLLTDSNDSFRRGNVAYKPRNFFF